jgi:hypothetical protein
MKSQHLQFSRRAQRATHLANAVMAALQDYIPRRNYREAFDHLTSLLDEGGYEVLCDLDRERAGLPPRNADGWTVEELHAMELAYLNIMNAPARLMYSGPATFELTVKTGEGQ